MKNGRGRPREIEDDVFCFILDGGSTYFPKRVEWNFFSYFKFNTLRTEGPYSSLMKSLMPFQKYILSYFSPRPRFKANEI